MKKIISLSVLLLITLTALNVGAEVCKVTKNYTYGVNGDVSSQYQGTLGYLLYDSVNAVTETVEVAEHGGCLLNSCPEGIVANYCHKIIFDPTITEIVLKVDSLNVDDNVKTNWTSTHVLIIDGLEGRNNKKIRIIREDELQGSNPLSTSAALYFGNKFDFNTLIIKGIEFDNFEGEAVKIEDLLESNAELAYIKITENSFKNVGCNGSDNPVINLNKVLHANVEISKNTFSNYQTTSKICQKPSGQNNDIRIFAGDEEVVYSLLIKENTFEEENKSVANILLDSVDFTTTDISFNTLKNGSADFLKIENITKPIFYNGKTINSLYYSKYPINNLSNGNMIVGVTEEEGDKNNLHMKFAIKDDYAAYHAIRFFKVTEVKDSNGMVKYELFRDFANEAVKDKVRDDFKTSGDLTFADYMGISVFKKDTFVKDYVSTEAKPKYFALFGYKLTEGFDENNASTGFISESENTFFSPKLYYFVENPDMPDTYLVKTKIFEEVFSLSNKDTDGDTISDFGDNCPKISNSGQSDVDGDGLGDECDDDIDGDDFTNDKDNCDYIENYTQKDIDGDNLGDECDDDIDGDGLANKVDNCQVVSNKNQEDMDKNGIGDKCTSDKDGDGYSGYEETKEFAKNIYGADITETKEELDKIIDPSKPFDNCQEKANTDQADIDKDGVGDVCDNCKDKANTDQKDSDGDFMGDVCDSKPNESSLGLAVEIGNWIKKKFETGAKQTQQVVKTAKEKFEKTAKVAEYLASLTDKEKCELLKDMEWSEDFTACHEACAEGYVWKKITNPEDKDGDDIFACADSNGCPSKYAMNAETKDCELIEDPDTNPSVDACPNAWEVRNSDTDECETIASYMDIDLDGVPDVYDNCPTVGNPPPQADSDGDGIGDACKDLTMANLDVNLGGGGDGGCALIAGGAVPNLGSILMLLPFIGFLARRKFEKK